MKHFFNFRKSKLLLFSLFAMLAGGVSPTWADTLTEDFESLTVDGTTLSNGWFVQGGTLKSTVTTISSSSSWDNAGNYNYEIISKGANNTEKSICNYESSNTSKYLVIPTEVTGKIRFYAGATRSGSGTRKVELYRVSYDAGTSVYTIGTRIGSTVYPTARTSGSAAPNWLANKQEIDLGSEHTMVAFLLQGAAIDEVEAEKYVFTPYVEPATISVVPTGNSAEVTWTAGATEEPLTGWNLEYKESTETTWTEVHGLGASTLIYSLSELEASTNYDVRVQAIYGTNESSWKSISFKTAKVATTATGFTDNFESNKSWEFINGTLTNNWVRGSAINNGGSNAMYISNDGGTSNAYNTNGATIVYATKLFAFEAGDYTISYDGAPGFFRG